jgi:hypothetical protein
MLTAKQRTTVYIQNANTQRKHICNSHKPTHNPKIAKELPLSQTEKLFFKIPSLLNFLKAPTQSKRQ